MINILFAARPEQFELYEAPLRQGLAQRGIHARVTTHCAPADVDYIVYAPNNTLQDFTPFTRCKAVLSLWAGVEKIVGNASLTQPLCRMVDSGLRQGMVEWVVGHTLRYHLGMDQHIVNPDHIRISFIRGAKLLEEFNAGSDLLDCEFSLDAIEFTRRRP